MRLKIRCNGESEKFCKIFLETKQGKERSILYDTSMTYCMYSATNKQPLRMTVVLISQFPAILLALLGDASILRAPTPQPSHPRRRRSHGLAQRAFRTLRGRVCLLRRLSLPAQAKPMRAGFMLRQAKRKVGRAGQPPVPMLARSFVGRRPAWRRAAAKWRNAKTRISSRL